MKDTFFETSGPPNYLGALRHLSIQHQLPHMNESTFLPGPKHTGLKSDHTNHTITFTNMLATCLQCGHKIGL